MTANIIGFLKSIKSHYPGGIPKDLLDKNVERKIYVLGDAKEISEYKSLLAGIVEKGLGVLVSNINLVTHENQINTNNDLTLIFGDFPQPSKGKIIKTYKLSEISSDEGKKRELWAQIKNWKAQDKPR